MSTWRVVGGVSGLLLALPGGAAAEPDALWSREEAASGRKAVYHLDLVRLRSLLERAPLEGTEGAAEPIEVAIPLPDGTLARFAVVESPVLEPALAAKYPEIRTYAGTGIDVTGAIAGFDLSPRGFHALVLGPVGQAFVEPVDGGTLRYASRPHQQPSRTPGGCVGEDLPVTAILPEPEPLLTAGSVTQRSNERRIYGLLVGATGEFTQAHGGTVASALAAITTTINGVNTVYRRDLGIHLTVLAESQNLIFTDPNDDVYIGGDLSCDEIVPSCLAPTDCLLSQNQCAADILVGNANYDLSIVFDDSNAGKAALGSVCNNSFKGRAATAGTDVGLAAHEIGHMFGGRHSFNGTTDNCDGNRDPGRAVEPGSGSTIMSYAGGCGAEALRLDRDLVFHHSSFLDMVAFSTSGVGDSCPGYAFTSNYAPVILGMTEGPYTIPRETPFLLSVEAYDPNSDPLTYSWEEYDIGGTSPSPPHEDDGFRPLFRAYAPTTAPERFFPLRNTVLLRENVPPDTVTCEDGLHECLAGEKLPTTTRTMHFNVMIRDGQDGVTVGYTTVTSHAGSGPFKVTEPSDTVTTYWTMGARREVKWDVANTDQPPVSCSEVRILLSTDAGETFPHVLASSTPNDGSEMVTLPFLETSFARIRVEAIGNVFYDVSAGFSIEELKVTNTNDSGRGSLRQAISDANDWPFGATIPLQIPGAGVRTIAVSSPLPPFVKQIALDGWDLGGPGYVGPPLLELNGAGCPFCDGLTLLGVEGFVNGVILNRFGGNAIVIRGGSAQSNLVQNCYIGTDSDGTTDLGNGGSGILIDAAPDNLLWGNVISGNKVGVTIQETTATANHLQRNSIGTNAAGTARIPNDDDGVRIVNAPANVIGGSSFGDERNVISGNGRFNPSNALVETFADAIDISGASATGNVVQGNYIGLNAAGTTPLDNTEHGVRINGAPNTLVGGTTAAARNVFADSLFINMTLSHGVHVHGAGATGAVIQGNYFGLDATGTVKFGIRGAGVFAESPAVQIGGSVAGARNVIVNARNRGGIWLENLAGGSQIRGNYIGTNAAGNVSFGTIVAGITTWTGNNTIVGNVIAGSSNAGIDIRENGASGNTIQGNLVGLDAGGTQDFGNGTTGIQIVRSGNNLIGGTTVAARNVISGNNQYGIHIAGPPGPAGPNLIQGNYIGTNAAGTAAVPNGTGVNIYETSNVALGGPAGAGNVISGNAFHGVEWYVSDPSSGLSAQANLAGTNAAGTAALPNGADGFNVNVNGPIAIQDNVLSGNLRSGLEVCCKPTTGTIRGNRIGTDATGTLSLGNGWYGLSLGTGSVTVGGLTSGEGNVVAFNGPGNPNFAGIRVGGGDGHRVRGNATNSNFSLGLDLGNIGVQPNDACDADGGPNGLQNYPVVTSVTLSGPNTVIAGSLNSTASTSFDVDFYASPACDPSGFGEGAAYVGTATVTTDGSCDATFTATIPGALTGSVTAIAVSPAGSSSEFSACRAVQPSPIAGVTGLAWADKTALSWSAVAGATEYRVLRGVAADYGNLLDQAVDSCERLLVPATATEAVLTEDPAAVAGSLYWYLVVGRSGIDEGPAGSATAGPRVPNVSGTCP